MKKRRRNIIIILGAVVVLVAAMLYANLGIERKDRVEVSVDEVERGTIVAKVSGPGKVSARTTVQISSSLLGRIVKLGVDEGDVVGQGEFLLRLDDVWYSSQVDQARARLERVKTELATAERESSDIEEQFARGLVSEKERDDIRAVATTYRQMYRESEAALMAAEDQLGKTVFHSPISGVVTMLNVEEGENVVTGTMNQPGTVIMTICDLSYMEVEVEIDETDIVDVAFGQRAEVDIEALSDTTLIGHVTEVGNSGITRMAGTQEEVTNFLVTVLIDDPHESLKPGMSATVEVVTAVHDSVLNIPIQSVVARLPSELEKSEDDPDSSGKTEPKKTRRSEREEEEEIEGVFIVDEEEEAKFVPVRTGISDELSIEIVEGELEESQEVISGPYKHLRTLKNGQALKVDRETEALKGSGEE